MSATATTTDRPTERPTDRPTGSAAGGSRAELLRGLEDEVSVMVRRLRRVVGERARMVHPDLQRSSYLMLTWLEQHGAQRASTMAETFCIDKGAISRQVQHLLDLGLVGREPDPADGRATLVSLSDEGRQRLAAVNDERRRQLDGRLGDWTAADLATFVGLLGRYNAALDA
jgi:DNA-binding MarR family transcriptional regulator